jgi:hypothetical protein
MPRDPARRRRANVRARPALVLWGSSRGVCQTHGLPRPAPPMRTAAHATHLSCGEGHAGDVEEVVEDLRRENLQPVVGPPPVRK